MNYLETLNNSFKFTRENLPCPPDSHLEYLSDYIFDFTTYDDEMSELFAKKAIEVCNAISNKTTFDYIKDPEQYKWYLIMCNMPFFEDKLTWGTSIRGAWWEQEIKFVSYGLWNGNTQLNEPIKFTHGEWIEFILAVIEFGKE